MKLSMYSDWMLAGSKQVSTIRYLNKAVFRLWKDTHGNSAWGNC